MKFLILIAVLAVQTFAVTGEATTDIKLREGPGKGYQAIGSVQSGAAFEVLEQNGDFYRINASGTEGFVAAQYVRVIKPLSTYEKIRNWTIYIGLGLYLIFALVVGEMMIRPSFMGWYKRQTYIYASNGNAFEDFFKQGLRYFAFELQIALLAVIVGGVVGWIWVIVKLVMRKAALNKRAALEEV